MKIDKTFIVNLPNRLDRLIPLIDYLKSIDFDYFPYYATRKKDGAEGLIITIEKLLQHCLDEGYNNFLVLEDDCKFLSDPREMIRKCFEQVPADYDLIYLGCNLWQKDVVKFSENLISLTDGYALQSVLYSTKGAEKVLKAIKERITKVPLDVLIKDKILCDGKSFCTFPMLTTQSVSYSDIECKVKDWNKVLNIRFEERTKHLL